MYNLAYIKESIEELYKNSPNIHITINIPRPRLIVEETNVVIIGVYRNFFKSKHATRVVLRVIRSSMSTLWSVTS